MTFTVRNTGDAPSDASWVDGVYISANAILGGDDSLVGQTVRVAPLAPGASYTQTVSATAPSASGAYRVFAVADAQNNVLETAPSGDADNAALAPQTLSVTGVTASVDALVDQIAYGQPIPLLVRSFVEGTATPAPNVPVKLRTTVRGYPSDTTVTTGSDGTLAANVYPKPGLAGIYQLRRRRSGDGADPTGSGGRLGRDDHARPNHAHADGKRRRQRYGHDQEPRRRAGDGRAVRRVPLASGLNVEVFLPNGSILGSGRVARRDLDRVDDSPADDGTLEFVVTSDQVAVLTTNLVYRSCPSKRRSSPVRRRSNSRHARRRGPTLFTVTLHNLGTAPTGPLRLVLIAKRRG